MTGRAFEDAWTKAAFWLLALLLFIGFVWLFNGILFPFILGIAIAYLLEPLMEKLVGWKLPRWAAAISILLVFFLFVFILFVIGVPILIGQLQELVAAAPGMLERFGEYLAPYIVKVRDIFGQQETEEVRQAIKDNLGNAFQLGGGVLSGLASGGMAVAGFFTTLVLTPIVAFFMMKQWPVVTEWVYGLIPREHYKTVTEILSRMNQKLAGFVRGQLMVAVILGLAYAIALTIAGLNFGFLIGLAAGLLSIIPLLGSTVGLVVSVVVAWFQAKSLAYVGLIGGIFILGQLLEGNIITPRILGKNVGLHPLWILFAILAGGSMFGIVGMLLAVPVTAVIGVLADFAATQYKKSPLYCEKAPAEVLPEEREP